jgi:hypothetical protein
MRQLSTARRTQKKQIRQEKIGINAPGTLFPVSNKKTKSEDGFWLLLGIAQAISNTKRRNIICPRSRGLAS